MAERTVVLAAGHPSGSSDLGEAGIDPGSFTDEGRRYTAEVAELLDDDIATLTRIWDKLEAASS